MLAAEAVRPDPVRERLLEYAIDGEFEVGTAGEPRRVRLRGKADRVDLLSDGRLRVIDYKTGRAPDARRSVQLPVYALSVQQQLERSRGLRVEVGEALYVAFGERDPVRVVIDGAGDDRMAEAQRRLTTAIDGIANGEFPPRPATPRLCRHCGYAAVCRKDYVVAD